MLKGKKILITAGPTWVAIDKVRVISNISTGKTGILIAEELIKKGAKVTLLLGPVKEKITSQAIKVFDYRFFRELKDLIQKQLKSERFDAVIHAAAVSDYQPRKEFKDKIKSGVKNLKLNLISTAKIINRIKKIDKEIFLVGFKLFGSASGLFKEARIDLAVVNSFKNDRYNGFILDKNRKILARANSRRELASKLAKILNQKI